MAKRDAPAVAADSWTFSAPKGPKGRFVPFSQSFWGIWGFAQNKTAAKELLEHLMEREQVELRCEAVVGYDIPPYAGMLDFKVWEDVEPPKGTVFNYPVRPEHMARPTSGFPRAARHRRADVSTRHLSDHAGEAAERPVDQAGDRLGEGRTGRVREVMRWRDRPA